MLYGFSKRYWAKVFGQQFAGLFPGRSGELINLAGAKLVSGNMAERDVAGEYRIVRSLRNADLVSQKVGGAFGIDRVLELGTGWRGADPMLMRLLGVAEVVTLDHANWLTISGLLRSVEELEQKRSLILERTSDHDAAVSLFEAIGSWNEATEPTSALADIGIRYEVGDLSGLLRKLQREKIAFDGFWTESVLQRIPKQSIAEIIQSAAGLMKTDAWFMHRTDQRDIHCLAHTRTGDHALRYLSIQDRLFESLMSGRFITQNRLREPQFQRIFSGAGLHARYVESRQMDSDLDFVASLSLAESFDGISVEDVAVRASIFVGQRQPNPYGEIERLRRVLDEVELES